MNQGTILVDRYSIIRLLSRGNSDVYVATDLRLRNIVILKRSQSHTNESDKHLEREAKILAHLRHPVLPNVMDYFREGSREYLVMQFVTGYNLHDLCYQRGKPFPIDEVVQWADQILDALEYLHGQHSPIIHGKIKPSNLMLTPQDTIVLIGFSMVRGELFGYTPIFEAPEVIVDTNREPRSDLFGLASSLYFLLTSELPLSSYDRAAHMMAGRDYLIPLEELNPQLTPALSQLVLRTMSIDPERRPPSATAMRAMLRSAHSLKGTSISSSTASHVQGLIEAKRRRLRILEQQAATFGTACPPHILTEIEDIRVEIGEEGTI